MVKSTSRSRKGAPGIVDVASRAGISPATVSRYYNSPDIVRTPTRKRIENAARELGYIRDRMAGALHNRFSGSFGLIVPTIDNAIFAEMIEAFSSRLRQDDRIMLIAAHQYNLKLEVGIVRSLLERRTDGIALVGSDHDPIALNMLSQRNIPTISIWAYDADSSIPCVGADNPLAGKMVTRHLLTLGHRKFVLLFPETENNDRARGRMEGVFKALNLAGIGAAEAPLLRCRYAVGEAKLVAEKLLSGKTTVGSLGDDFTAIICGNDVIARGVLYACRNLCIDVPGSLSVVGIGDFGGAEYLDPPLTTVRLPAKRIGHRAAEILLAMSETGLAPAIRHEAIAVEPEIRGSTGPVPNRP